MDKSQIEQQRAKLELVVNAKSPVHGDIEAQYQQDLLEQSEAAADVKAMKKLLSAIVERCNTEGFVHQPAYVRVAVQHPPSA